MKAVGKKSDRWHYPGFALIKAQLIGISDGCAFFERLYQNHLLWPVYLSLGCDDRSGIESSLV